MVKKVVPHDDMYIDINACHATSQVRNIEDEQVTKY